MKVTVKLFAHYRIGRFKISVRDYPAGTSVRAGVAELGFHDAGPGVVLVNGTPASLDRMLEDGDTLALFPLVSGG